MFRPWTAATCWRVFGCSSRDADDIVRAPVIGHSALRGLADTLAILEESAADDPSVAVALQTLRQMLRGEREGHRTDRPGCAWRPLRWSSCARDNAGTWRPTTSELLLGVPPGGRTRGVEPAPRDRYLRWMETLAPPPDSTLRVIGRTRSACGAGPCATRRRSRRWQRRAADAVDAILAYGNSPGLAPEWPAWLDQSWPTSMRRRGANAARNRREVAGAVRGCATLRGRHQHALSL